VYLMLLETPLVCERRPRFTYLPLIAAHPVSLLAGHALLVGAAGLPVLFVVFVVLPAIWSRKPARRRAALAVLDRICRTFRL
jgi:hypothetical protein